MNDHPPDRDRVIIFDTTLRDGEQSPGCSMTTKAKLRVAQALAALRVDVIEAGFPIASEGDFEAVSTIARTVEGPTIAALARCHPTDIERAFAAIQDAPKRRIHVFLATSALHREHKLGLKPSEVIQRAVDGVARARDLCGEVEFSPEDASRTELDFLAEVVERVIEAGAATINLPDTVGYATPDEYGQLFRHLSGTVRGIDRVTLSAHCHDDLGLATANSLAAVQAGARQVECTVNGIGERAGNCPLEELVMALQTRDDALSGWAEIDTTKLYPTSRLVQMVTGSTVQRNKAIVGENAFQHESGIHQHGILQDRRTYEIIDPRDIGVETTQLVLGKHSGRHAVRDRIEHLGLEIDDSELDRIMERFKQLADKKPRVYDADLESLLLDKDLAGAGPWRLESLHTSHGSDGPATATVTLHHRDRDVESVEAAVGDGPIHAVFTAIARATGFTAAELLEFRVRSVSAGEDAQGEAIVDLRIGGESWRGRGLSTDIVEAGGIAILDVVNRAIRRSGKIEPTTAAAEKNCG